MDIIDQIKAARIIAIIRGNYTLDALRIMAQTLYESGFNVLEVTLNSPGAIDAIRMLHTEMGDQLLIGAGTVMEALQVDAVAEAGGRFIVTPETYLPVITRSLELKLEPVPGVFTPTEIMTAHRAGARLIKLFPASVGGVEYLKSIYAPLSHVQLIPTGGVEIEQVRDYLKAGAVAVGMGSALIPKHFEGSQADVDLLRERALHLTKSLE